MDRDQTYKEMDRVSRPKERHQRDQTYMDMDRETDSRTARRISRQRDGQ